MDEKQPSLPDGDFDAFLDMTFGEWLASRSPKDREYYLNRAKYAGNNISKEERLFLASESKAFQEGVRNIGHWKLEVMYYPPEPLIGKRINKNNNPDLPFRAKYLMEAISCLLDIADAPSSMKSDFRKLFAKNLPTESVKRAEMQDKMIEFPHLSETQLAKRFSYDQTRLRSEVQDGKLERHPRLDDRTDD